MKEGRCDPCVVSYRLSSIYVIGGLIETENPSHCGSVQRYDISTDRWDVVALCFSPGMNRFNCQAAVCNDKIIVLQAPDNRASGFLSGYNLCFTCYLYTPETNEWQMFCAPSIPTLAPEIDSILYSSDKPFFSVFYETFEEPLSENIQKLLRGKCDSVRARTGPFRSNNICGEQKTTVRHGSFLHSGCSYGARL